MKIFYCFLAATMTPLVYLGLRVLAELAVKWGPYKKKLKKRTFIQKVFMLGASKVYLKHEIILNVFLITCLPVVVVLSCLRMFYSNLVLYWIAFYLGVAWLFSLFALTLSLVAFKVKRKWVKDISG